MNTNALKVTIAILALGAAAYFGWKQFQSEEAEKDAFATKSSYQCASCNNIFDASLKEALAASDAGKSLSCPKCGKEGTFHVFRCPNCSEALIPVGHSGFPQTCPSCKKKTS